MNRPGDDRGGSRPGALGALPSPTPATGPSVTGSRFTAYALSSASRPGQERAMDDLVQQFLGSGAAASAIQALTTQHGLTDPQARQAVEATAEGSARAIGTGKLDLGALAGAVGGGGLGGLAESLGLGGRRSGGLPTALVQPVTDY